MSLHPDNAIGTACCDDIDRAFLRIAMFLLKVCMIALFVELAMGLGAKAQTPEQAFEEVGPLEGLTGSQVYNRLAGPDGLGWNVAPAENGIGQVFTKDLGNGTTVAIRVDPAHGGPGTGQPIDRNFAGDVPHVHKESVPTILVGDGTNPGNYRANAPGKRIYDVATNEVIPQPVAPVDQPRAHAPTSRELPAVQPNEVTVVDPSTGLSQPRPELVYPNAQYEGNPFWPPVPAEEAASCAASTRGRNLGRVAGALFALVAGVQGAREEIEAARQEGRDPSKVMAVLRGWYDFSVAPFVSAHQVTTETFNHQIDSMEAAVARGEDTSEWAEAITASAKTLYIVSGAQSAVEGCGEAVEMGKSFLEEYRANRRAEEQEAAGEERGHVPGAGTSPHGGCDLVHHQCSLGPSSVGTQ
jgi:hypothetical protein